FERQLSDKYRKERGALEDLLDPAKDEQSDFSPALALLRNRSERLREVFRELKAAEAQGELTVPVSVLAASYLHMHANRFLRSAGRAQELVLCDFLIRSYESR